MSIASPLWEYETKSSAEIGALEPYLKRRQRLGWELKSFDGQVLHLRRRVGREKGSLPSV